RDMKSKGGSRGNQCHDRKMIGWMGTANETIRCNVLLYTQNGVQSPSKNSTEFIMRLMAGSSLSRQALAASRKHSINSCAATLGVSPRRMTRLVTISGSSSWIGSAVIRARISGDSTNGHGHTVSMSLPSIMAIEISVERA